MASTLAITAATSNVLLDAQRRGEASFTVSNASGRPLRARVSVVPAPPAEAAWFAVLGTNERDFAVNGAQQFTVNIVAPPSVAPGNYAFRMDAVGVENPDDDFVRGPAVAFEVTGVAVVQPTAKKGYLAALLGSTIGLLVGVAIGFLLGALVGGLLGGISSGAGGIASTAMQWAGALLGAVLGCGFALRTGGFNYFAETPLILAGVGPVWAAIEVGILLLIGSPRILTDGGTPALALLCISTPIGVFVPPLVARAITLFWKTKQL
ncbi:MAG: hypothetical protein ABI670_07445 [Chloroflexota bacterium]